MVNYVKAEGLVPSCSHHNQSAFVGMTTSYAIPGKENGQQL